MRRADDDFECGDQAGLGGVQRPDSFVCVQGQRSGRRIAVEPIADEPCEVAGHAVDPHGAEVDEAADAIALEEEVVRAGVAQAGLESYQAAGRLAERIEQPGGDDPGQSNPSDCGIPAIGLRWLSRSSFDGLLERVESALNQLHDRLVTMFEPRRKPFAPLCGQALMQRRHRREGRLQAARRRGASPVRLTG